MRLYELRKNPDQNPKISVNQSLIDELQHTHDDVIPEMKNNFTSFTEIDKLGINPINAYNTPLGIYAYPTEYIVENRGEHEPLKNMEFAGKRPFANTFKVKGNIIDLNNMTQDEANEYYNKLISLTTNISKQDYEKCKDYIHTLINGNRYSIGKTFWYVTNDLSRYLRDYIHHKSSTTTWNYVFRSIGIDGAIDRYDGIIYYKEPTQAVFFSKSIIYNIKRFNNVTYPHTNKINRQLLLSEIKYFLQFIKQYHEQYYPFFETNLKKLIYNKSRGIDNILSNINGQDTPTAFRYYVKELIPKSHHELYGSIMNYFDNYDLLKSSKNVLRILLKNQKQCMEKIKHREEEINDTIQLLQNNSVPNDLIQQLIKNYENDYTMNTLKKEYKLLTQKIIEIQKEIYKKNKILFLRK